ncbi:hypothetical protein I5Q83_10485 [Enterocloster clostridioformis]|uniref:transglutaminase domain-containing protein n=2 Tax=Enterocloster clostridioformis TaxID=1531 RepID=UPI0012482F66|nr:transglutaminase domain-containing protein [Enterocloster clostridioformis]NDO29279.1 hypothetical protein [Enterocloster clostridioformis]QQR02648.1 hypothetical protein I5Q83_10485 [Enterocloster clostridioformis]
MVRFAKVHHIIKTEESTMKNRKIVSLLLTGAMTAALLTAPAQAAEVPQPEPYTISVDHWSREDFSQEANPSVFTGVYSRELYNTIRQTMVDGTSGTAPAYTMVSKEDYSAVKNLIGRMEGVLRYEHHVPQNFTNYWQYLDYFAVSAEMPENYQAPLDFIQPVIDHAGMLATDRERVEYFNDYIRTLLAYEKGKTAGIIQTFAPHAGELKAACGSYARALKFLCAAADIPCFTISTKTHTWNLVYMEGQWLHVDVSANDLSGRNSVLLIETYGGTDQAPEATAFLKELYIPGSTK